MRAGSENFAPKLELLDAAGSDADIERTAKECGVKPTGFREFSTERYWR